MKSLRTIAACHADALAKLTFPPVSRPVDVTDAEAFPNIAEALAHYASMTPERIAELENKL